jgi:hypothetical protein
MYSSDFRTAVVSVYNSFQSMKRVALLFKISRDLSFLEKSSQKLY